MLNFPSPLPATIEYVTVVPSGSTAETWPTASNADAFSATVKLYVDDAKTGGDAAVVVRVGVATGVVVGRRRHGVSTARLRLCPGIYARDTSHRTMTASPTTVEAPSSSTAAPRRPWSSNVKANRAGVAGW